MARYIGIDIGSTHVRALLLSTGYKRVAIEAVNEVAIDSVESLERALEACAGPMLPHSDGIAVAIDGDGAFVHRLKLPLTARKQIDAVLPFELESQMPIDMSELVYDYRVLRSEPNATAIEVIAALARTEQVKERIELVKRALGREPERVSCGSLVLGNLSLVTRELSGKSPVALVDLGNKRTEVAVLSDGEPLFVRTLSRGVAGLPESAPALIAELRQTFLAFLASTELAIESVILLGGGAGASGADQYLSHELGLPVRALPTFQLEAVPDIVLALPRFAKALALAAGLSGKAVDLNLRSGPLAYQRGFGFLKERAPLLAGLVAATLVSFLFSSWADLHALGREHDELVKALAVQSQQALGEELTDPAAVAESIDRAKAKDEPDPMPHMDAFDVMVELSNAIPMTVTHDIEELDVDRTHVRVNGIVPTTKDAQDLSTKMAELNRCVSGSKIAKVSQVVNDTRQKYVLEFELKCPEDTGVKKKTKAAEAPSEDKP